VAPDFGLVSVGSLGGHEVLDFDLLTSNGTYSHRVRVDLGIVAVPAQFGNGSRCGTTTAVLLLGDDFSGNKNLYMVYRTASGDSLTSVVIATDALTTVTDAGLAPSICCSSDATVFYVAYATTTANGYKVLKVSATGTVLATYTGTFAGLAGIWVENSSASANQAWVATTGTNGLQVVVLTNMVLTRTLTHNPGFPGADVVLGRESDTGAWFAYRMQTGTGNGNIVVGKLDPTTPASALAYRTFYGDNTGIPRAGVRWSIAHQPILINGRVYLTLIAATNNEDTGTWQTLDLTSWLGAFTQPMLVARGSTEATVPFLQPATATATTAGNGWLFSGMDWSRFDQDSGGSASGRDAALGLNRVTLSQPRSTLFGDSTVFSGSVPHVIQRGQCAELGFPFLAGVPGMDVANTGAGAVGIGSYQITACWRWTDDAGQIHRSSPAPVRTITVAGAGAVLSVYVTNPWLTEKEFGSVKIEVYSTDVGATGNLFLQQTVTPVFTDGYTAVTLNGSPILTSEILYTDGGVLANVHVSGDGGVATVGRRLWLASANTISASKLHITGEAPGFSDSAANNQPVLQLALPAGAGRIVALESLEDKLAVFCERGIFAIQDGGPDNIGVGPDFMAPYRVSDLGIAGPRAICRTDTGIAFCTAITGADAGLAGPWHLDRGLSLTYLGRAIRNHLDTAKTNPEMAFSAERQALFLTTGEGIVTLDMRVGKWSLWTVASALGTLRSIATVSGVLWSLANEPAPYTATNGIDVGDGNVTMTIATEDLPASGRGGLGWSRVRSVSTLGTRTSGAHTLTITAVLDQTTTLTSDPISQAASTSSTTWPANRQAPEWRLPQQKCSSLQVRLSATPAVAEWTAVELQIVPLPPRSPAGSRS
jgi:hypothetical protein